MRKRNHTVTIRMNNEEYNLLQSKVKESGRTQQEVVIKAIADLKIASTEEVEELKRLNQMFADILSQLRGATTNINQIARKLHTDGEVPNDSTLYFLNKNILKYRKESEKIWLVNKTINKRTNTHGAMRNCIEYVLRQDKTSELLTYVTGPYCHDEINYDLVYRTFLEEKKMWDKDSGRMYAHNIISWHKDEQITPEQALEFGKEFAEKWFSGFQTLVAVHKDKDHIHCHLVTNSVSYEDGRKLHNTRKDLERMKQLTNQMCRERGLTVAEKGKHFDGSQIEKGEVIAWSKDKYNLFRQQVKDSFVADCAMAVLKALENCISKEKFIEKMKQFGWNVNWTEKRKHITFQNQDGKKVRDSNLSKTFHLDISKEGLENEFNGNYERIRAEAERTNGSDEELAGYYRQVEAACEGAGRNAGESDGREGRVAGEKSEDERVYSGISGKDAQVENGKTEVVLRESRNARRNAECRTPKFSG